jgi:hypothetical protein
VVFAVTLPGRPGFAAVSSQVLKSIAQYGSEGTKEKGRPGDSGRPFSFLLAGAQGRVIQLATSR